MPISSLPFVKVPHWALTDWSKARIIAFLVMLLLALVVPVWPAPATPAPPQRTPPRLALGVERDHFTVNGQAQFLVLVSYFDALRASDETLESDFAYLKAKGINGIRIFPNWWDWNDQAVPKIRFSKRTVFDAQGNLRAEPLVRLRTVLDKALAHGLIVDVSFAYEVVRDLSALTEAHLTGPSHNLTNRVKLDAYRRGIMAVTRELKPYQHIFFDLQNEYDGGWTR